MLFGGGATTRDPTGFTVNSPGLFLDTQRTRRNSNDVFFTTNVNRTPGGLADLAARRLPGLVNATASLRGQFSPGFGILTQRAREVNERATGNLRDTLSRRRIRGSTFGEAALARQQRENAAILSEAALAELQTQTALIQQESGLLAQGVNQVLAEAGLASQNTATLAQLFTQADAVQAQLEAASNPLGGIGQFLGTALGVAATGGFGGFGGGFAAPSGPTLAGGTDFLGNSLGFPTGINNPGGFSFI